MSETETDKPMRRWERLVNKHFPKDIGGWGALIGILTGLLTLAAAVVAAVIWASGLVSAVQPAADQRVLSSLSAGGLYESFAAKFPKGPATKLAGVGDLDEHLFVLDNAYVVAFVDPEERVKAYGMIMKNGATSKPIETSLGPITLGRTTFAEALSSGLAKVSSGCGAQHQYHYEVSQSTGATGNREYAFGITSTALNAASAAEKFSPIGCKPEVEAAVQEYVYNGIAPESDLLLPPRNYEGYLASMRTVREGTAIDSMFVATPGTEILEEMIYVHPSEVAEVDPWQE